MSDKKKINIEELYKKNLSKLLSKKNNFNIKELIEQIKKNQLIPHDVVIHFLDSKGKIPDLEIE